VQSVKTEDRGSRRRRARSGRLKKTVSGKLPPTIPIKGESIGGSANKKRCIIGKGVQQIEKKSADALRRKKRNAERHSNSTGFWRKDGIEEAERKKKQL